MDRHVTVFWDIIIKWLCFLSICLFPLKASHCRASSRPSSFEMVNRARWKNETEWKRRYVRNSALFDQVV